MASVEYRLWLENFIAHTFENRSLLEKALTGPGAEGDKNGSDEEKAQYQGNRPLGVFGKILLSFMSKRRVFSTGESGHDHITAALDPSTASRYHVRRAKELGIHSHMKLSPRQRGEAQSLTLQLTIYAIVSAAYQDCKEDLSVLDGIIQRLFIKKPSSPCIDPQKTWPIPYSDMIFMNLFDDNTSEQSSPLISNSDVPNATPNLAITGGSNSARLSICYAASYYLIEDNSFEDAELATYNSSSASRYLEEQENAILDDETSLFPKVGEPPFDNQDKEESSDTQLDLPTSAIVPMKRGQGGGLIEINITQGIPAPKARKTSTSNLRSKSIRLDSYISFEKRRCESLGLAFSWADENLAMQALELPHKNSDLTTLKTLFLVIGSPESLVALQEILKTQRNAPMCRDFGGSCNLPLGDRLRGIENIDYKIASLVLKKRYYTYQFFLDYNSARRRTTDGFINESIQSISKQKQPTIGNPLHVEDCQIIDGILKDAYPDLSPSSVGYSKKRLFIRNLRRLGERFDMLIRTFGYGILGLLSSPSNELGETPTLIITDEQILESTDLSFKKFVLLLEKLQGRYLRAASAAVLDIVTALVQAQLDPTISFVLEQTQPSKILEIPRCHRLLDLISKTKDS